MLCQLECVYAYVNLSSHVEVTFNKEIYGIVIDPLVQKL